MNRTIADGVALLHGLLVVYLAGGTLLIAVGLWRRWEFVRNFLFRFSHLLLCLGVNLFEWANLPCPLTTLEWHLREQDSNRASFIQHYVTQAIHVPVPPSMLARETLPLLLLLIALYKWAGPRRTPSPAVASTPRPEYSPWRTSLTAVLLPLGIACTHAALGSCCDCLIPESPTRNWNTYAFQYSSIFLAATLAACLLTPRACGLGLGSLARWLRHDLKILVVLALPPLAVITVYACLTSKPFEGMLMGDWLVKSIAQEVLFAGFIYARLADVFGAPGERIRDAFAWPMIITPLLFLLWHWPNSYWMQYSYFAFQCLYVFIGGWWSLNLRRWTGSIWPGAALHVLVNYLAAAL